MCLLHFVCPMGGQTGGDKHFPHTGGRKHFYTWGAAIFTKFSVSGGGGDCDVDGHELKLKKFKNLKRLVGTGNSSQL